LDAIYARHFGLVEHSRSFTAQLLLPFKDSALVAVLGLLAAGLGGIAAYLLYANASKDPIPEKFSSLSRTLRNGFYLNQFYEATVVRFHELVAAIAAGFDRWLIAGASVRGTHGTTELLGRALRLLQTGNLQTYAFLFALGVVFVLYLVLK